MSYLDRLKERAFRRPEEVVPVVFPAIPAVIDPDTGAILQEEVPEWRDNWTIRGMTARERDEFEVSLQKPALQSNGKTRTKSSSGGTDMQNFRARFLARCIWDGDKRPFLGVEGEQVLGDQPATVLEPLVNVAQRLNGMTREEIEELEGNSEETTEDDSSSSSLEHSDELSLN